MSGGAARGLSLCAHVAACGRVSIPSCRTQYTHEYVEQDDGWNADDTIDALLEQDEDLSIGGQAPPVVGTDAVAKRRCARFEV